jgi:hypothetical protein
MSSPEIETGLSESFRAVLRDADETFARYEDAVDRHASTTNPVLRLFTKASLLLRAASAGDTETDATEDYQLEQIRAGEMPMFED